MGINGADDDVRAILYIRRSNRDIDMIPNDIIRYIAVMMSRDSRYRLSTMCVRIRNARAPTLKLGRNPQK
jgi:hypothetical protein